MTNKSSFNDVDLISDSAVLFLDRGTASMMDFDDRQLSSDLEKCLRITPEDSFIPRGPENSDVKKDSDRTSCVSSNFTSPYRHSIETNPLGKCYPAVSSCSHDNNSLSSLGLETDDGSVGAEILHPILPEMGEGHEKQNKFDIWQFPRADATKNAVHYPFEDRLMRYECFNATDEPTTGYHLWQNNQNIQAKSEVPDDDNDVMIIEDIAEQLTYEVDEIGEGPLHILSAVMDTTVIAKVLDILQELGIIKQCINLQSKRKQTPLFLAVQTKNIPYVGWLLDNGADPNIQGTLYINRDEYIWRAPLHLAAMMGDDAIAIVRLLTKSKSIEINQLSIGDKLTPLHLALMQHSQTRSCRQLIFELIDKGADITIREQKSSKTPFMLAIETRDLNLVRELLERFPAEVCRTMLQEQTRSGDTCLHIAAGLSKIHTSQKEILLRMLVTNGANGSIANNIKELPRDFAKVEWDRIRKT